MPAWLPPSSPAGKPSSFRALASLSQHLLFSSLLLSFVLYLLNLFNSFIQIPSPPLLSLYPHFCAPSFSVLRLHIQLNFPSDTLLVVVRVFILSIHVVKRLLSYSGRRFSVSPPFLIFNRKYEDTKRPRIKTSNWYNKSINFR